MSWKANGHVGFYSGKANSYYFDPSLCHFYFNTLMTAMLEKKDDKRNGLL